MRANWTEERRQRSRDYARERVANMTEERREQHDRKQNLCDTGYRAKKKGIPFELTLDYINEIWPDGNKCPVFGIPFVRGKGEQCPASPTLDRIEPNKGYTIGNVQVISALANRIKTDATAAEVMIVAQYLIKEERERAST